LGQPGGVVGGLRLIRVQHVGSKEQLFAEAVDAAFAPRTVVGNDAATLSRQVAETLAARTTSDADDLDPFLLTLRSVGNPRAAEIVRAGIEAHVGRHLTELLSGPNVQERAELLLALIAGLWLMRKVIATTALSRMQPTTLARQLSELIEVIVAPTISMEADVDGTKT
jgi:hypothetical protein